MENFIEAKAQFECILINLQNNMYPETFIDEAVQNLGVTHIMNIEHKKIHKVSLSDEEKEHNRKIEEETLMIYQKLSYEEKKQKLFDYLKLSYQSCEAMIRMTYPKEFHSKE